MSQPDTYQELADLLHAELCYRAPECARYYQGHAHSQYYADRAQAIIEETEPIIGLANVVPVVRAIMNEMA
jgi:hypothetical protein